MSTAEAVDVAQLAALVQRRAPSAGGTRVVAVDGPSGSGKTSLAAELAPLLDDAPVVHLDDLYPGWDGLDAVVPRLLAWVLEPLARGEAAGYHRYDWAAGGYAEWHGVPASPALVVEGCGSGARACAALLSLLVWVDAPSDLRFARGMARDGGAYGPYWQRWARQEAAHFAAEGTRERADVRLDGELPGHWRAAHPTNRDSRS